MLASTFARTVSVCALAGVLLTACGGDSPTAPKADRPTPPKETAKPPTPPSPPTGLPNTPPPPPKPNGSVTGQHTGTPDGLVLGYASAASTSGQSLQAGAQGMSCTPSSGQIELAAPRPRGTQSFVQSFETAWWYPVLYRWENEQWVLVGPFSWASTRLPSTSPQWTTYEGNQPLRGWLTTQPPGYYAIVSHVYFDASQQWASQWENATVNSPVAQTISVRQWCQL